MSKKLRVDFGIRVKAFRKMRGYSQEDFAENIGYARSYISRIERGKANPSLDAICILADALSVHVSEFFPLQFSKEVI